MTRPRRPMLTLLGPAAWLAATAWNPMAWSQESPAPAPAPATTPLSTPLGTPAAPAAAPAGHEQMDMGLPSAAVPPAPVPGQPYKRTPAPADAYVYIGWPNDGEVIRSTHVRVWFGTRNFGVAPANTNVPNTGHHHLLVDTTLPPLDEPIPNDKNHLHFGRGQTETVLDLPPGRHTLQLLMGDANHVPHDPPLMSKKITIIVQP